MSQKIKVVAQPKKQPRENSARGQWWAFIQQYNGKSIQDFCKAAQANPPSTPKAGKLQGKCEPPMGWVRYFVSAKLITLQGK